MRNPFMLQAFYLQFVSWATKRSASLHQEFHLEAFYGSPLHGRLKGRFKANVTENGNVHSEVVTSWCLYLLWIPQFIPWNLEIFSKILLRGSVEKKNIQTKMEWFRVYARYVLRCHWWRFYTHAHTHSLSHYLWIYTEHPSAHSAVENRMAAASWKSTWE